MANLNDFGGGHSNPLKCRLNLAISLIDADSLRAKCQFALERGKKNGDALAYPQDLTPYIRLNSGGEIPACPASGSYSVALVGSHPVCSLGGAVTPAHLIP